MKKAIVTQEFLQEQYVKNNRSSQDLAEELGVSAGTIVLRLREAGIPVRPRGARYNIIDLTGRRFGKLTVISQVPGAVNTRWLCRCDCGHFKEAPSDCIREGRTKNCGKCENHYNWKGCGEISGQYLCALKSSARRRNIKFDVTIEEMWKLFIQQDRKCAITKERLIFARSYGDDSSLQTASLDRIDSKGFYEIKNVRWVHKAVNIMKWNMTDDELYMWAKKIVDNINTQQ